MYIYVRDICTHKPGFGIKADVVNFKGPLDGFDFSHLEILVGRQLM